MTTLTSLAAQRAAASPLRALDTVPQNRTISREASGYSGGLGRVLAYSLSQELICARQLPTLVVDVKQGEAAETTIWLLRSYGCVGVLFTMAVARSHGRCR